MVDDSEPDAESDLRRRAAWLLVMLAVVAVLLVIVISAVARTGGDSGNAGDGKRPLDNAVSTPNPNPDPSTTQPRRHHHTKPGDTSTPPESSSSSPQAGQTTCPTPQTCVLDGDIGNGVQAVNDYRTRHGKPAVPGAVSEQAQTCAVHNGNGCSGGWAETELATANGAEAVQKILQFGKLLDPNLKTFEVGWAYDPGAKLYYFAIIRND